MACVAVGDEGLLPGARSLGSSGLVNRRFLIQSDPRTCHLVLELSGMWDWNDACAYRNQLRMATLQAVGRGGFRGSLLDASGLHLQSADIANEHGRLMNIARRMFGVRAAVLMTGPQSKLQMRRLAEDTGHRFFTDREEAVSWLYD